MPTLGENLRQFGASVVAHAKDRTATWTTGLAAGVGEALTDWSQRASTRAGTIDGTVVDVSALSATVTTSPAGGGYRQLTSGPSAAGGVNERVDEIRAELAGVTAAKDGLAAASAHPTVVDADPSPPADYRALFPGLASPPRSIDLPPS